VHNTVGNLVLNVDQTCNLKRPEPILSSSFLALRGGKQEELLFIYTILHDVFNFAFMCLCVCVSVCLCVHITFCLLSVDSQFACIYFCMFMSAPTSTHIQTQSSILFLKTSRRRPTNKTSSTPLRHRILGSCVCAQSPPPPRPVGAS